MGRGEDPSTYIVSKDDEISSAAEAEMERLLVELDDHGVSEEKESAEEEHFLFALLDDEVIIAREESWFLQEDLGVIEEDDLLRIEDFFAERGFVLVMKEDNRFQLDSPDPESLQRLEAEEGFSYSEELEDFFR
jgi:hypothetical protein